MVKTDIIRSTVVKGMREYLGCPVIKSNQTEDIPKGKYVSYTIITPATANNGTYGEYEDGKARKPVKQIHSYTAHSTDYAEAVTLANQLRGWLEYVGTVYLNDNGVIVETVGNITDRSNLLTSDYQYSYGCDCTFWAYDEIDIPDNGVIEHVDLNGIEVDTPPTVDD